MAKYRARVVFEAPGLRLIAIEVVAVEYFGSAACLGLCATLAPRAVIAIGQHGTGALDPATGQATTLDRLRRDLPGLDEVLAAATDARGT